MTECSTLLDPAIPTRAQEAKLPAFLQILSTRPWTQVGLDLSGPHPTPSHGHTWLIVFPDHFSKQVRLAAAPDNDANPLTAERIAVHGRARCSPLLCTFKTSMTETQLSRVKEGRGGRDRKDRHLRQGVADPGSIFAAAGGAGRTWVAVRP